MSRAKSIRAFAASFPWEAWAVVIGANILAGLMAWGIIWWLS